jgi:hypothetical protein
MAKKVIASLKTQTGKSFAKFYKAVKNKKGAYSFKSVIMTIEEAKLTLKNDNSAI